MSHNNNVSKDAYASLPKGASYSRFSSEMQKDTSIDDQRRMCRQRSERDGVEIHPHHEFEDRATSGATSERSGLDSLRAAARVGEFSVLYVYSLSRLSRESLFTMQLLKELEHYKVRLISVSEGVDTSQAGSYDFSVLLGLQNERYLRELSNQVRRGQEGTVLAGFSAGDTCFGYVSVPSPDGATVGRGRNVKPRMVYAVDKVTAGWVVQIFQWFADDGQTIGWIVRQLNLLQVPKDRRASHQLWYRDLVLRILRSEKYVGRWPWRQTRRIRDWETRKVKQEAVPEHEREQFTRSLPELQIVESSLFERARQRLNRNRAASATHRDQAGRLSGAASSNRKRYLLDGLLKCKLCGRRFAVLDSEKKYYNCLGHTRDQCSFVTSVPRELAEKLVFDAVSQRLLKDKEWRSKVFQATLASWKVLTASRPDEVAALRKKKADLDAMIRRLLNVIERSDNPPSDISLRLADRKRELRDVETELTNAESGPRISKEEPTEASVDAELDSVLELLQSGTPAAIEAFQALIDGPILIEQCPVPNRRRQYAKGELRLRPIVFAAALLNSRIDVHEDTTPPLLISLDFRRTTFTEDQARRALALFEAGQSCSQLARELGVTLSRITAIFKFAHETLGLPYPETRRRSSIDPVGTPIADQVMERWHSGLLIRQIADEFGACPPTIRRVVARWHASQGLPMPDGRARRKTLPLKQRPANDASKDDVSGGGPQARTA